MISGFYFRVAEVDKIPAADYNALRDKDFI